MPWSHDLYHSIQSSDWLLVLLFKIGFYFCYFVDFQISEVQNRSNLNLKLSVTYVHNLNINYESEDVTYGRESADTILIVVGLP